MSLFEKYIKGVRFILPTPFTIAILLTIFTMVLAYIWPWNDYTNNSFQKLSIILDYWNKGLWNIGGLSFAVQMMLMLLLGYVLALSPAVDKLINKLIPLCKNNSLSVALITLVTLIMSWFNWGLGLVFGAIFCKKVIRYASKKNIPLNNGLIGAAGYSGIMVWHGGISGSSLIKISEPGHISSLVSDSIKPMTPKLIDFSNTVFSSMNLFVTIILFITLPLLMYIIGKVVNTEVPKKDKLLPQDKTLKNLIGAEKIDHSKFIGKLIGLSIFSYCVYSAIEHPNTKLFQFINPNFLNLTLLGMAMFFQKSIISFLKATEKAIGCTVGILIQFPLYFGIMGIFQSTGIINDISVIFQNISNPKTYPIFTFISAGIINFFVPSGGGQWYIQGPIIIQSAIEMGIPLNKSIMALAYGDQVTNMMQPFWALPLLGITGLNAKDILPFTFILMVIGILVFASGLLLF